MNKKKLLLSAALACLSVSLAQAEPASAPPAAFEPSLTEPAPAPFRPLLDCDSGYELGDMDFSEELEYDDLIKLLNCVFLYPTSPDCLMCVGDINCDTFFSPADLIILLRFYYSIYSEFPQAKLKCPD